MPTRMFGRQPRADRPGTTIPESQPARNPTTIQPRGLRSIAGQFGRSAGRRCSVRATRVFLLGLGEALSVGLADSHDVGPRLRGVDVGLRVLVSSRAARLPRRLTDLLAGDHSGPNRLLVAGFGRAVVAA